MGKFLFFLFFLFKLGLWSQSPNDPLSIDSLRGLLFYDPSRQKPARDCFTGIALDMNVPNEKRFIKIMTNFLEKPFTQETIYILKKEIVSFYQEEGYPIVGVFMPEGQSFSCDTVQILILVGRIGAVQSEGANYFSNEKIGAMFRTKRGEPIRSETVNEDLQWMNLNPFRTTTLVYKPGKEIGETDATLTTKDRFPLRVYGGYENTGNPLTGTPRLLAGFNVGNLFGQDQELNYLFVTEPHPKNWYAHLAGYMIPLPWRDQFRVSGSYTLTRPTDLPDIGLRGSGWQVNGRYSSFFSYSQFECTAFAGYEFKRTNNFLTFGVDTLLDDLIDVSQFVLGLDANATYQFGATVLGLKLYLSPGNMTRFNESNRFQTQRKGAKSNYIFGELTIDQLLQLPWQLTWALNSTFQGASAKLLPSEAFVLGGYYTVRGYDEFASLSDFGILLKNEIRSPAVKLPTFRSKKHEIQFLGFWDFGLSVRDDHQVVDNQSTILSSIGPALRYQFDERLFIRLDWGVQLSHINNLQTNSGRRSRLHSGVQLSF